MIHRTILTIAFAIAFLGTSNAEFEKWTNKEGKTAELELLEVTGEGDGKAGIFNTRKNTITSIKASSLAEDDAKRLDDWLVSQSKPQSKSGIVSVFDEIFDGNLVKLEGKRFKKYRLLNKPSKYYVFYYTASWCPPCQKFTPVLVDFYNSNKNENFEIILITSDRNERNMEDYASNKKMPWPQLKYSKVEKFNKKFNHQVSHIPTVVVCDLEGNVVSQNGRNLKELKELVK